MDHAGAGEVLEMSLSDYQRKFMRLNVNTSGGRASPHKICMLLAVLDIARAGSFPINRIVFGPALLERYERFFAAVRAPGDQLNAFFPYFHLGGNLRGKEASFWHLHAIPGRESTLADLKSVQSTSEVTANIAFASLDDALFELLQSPVNIEALAETLARHWFDRGLSDLGIVVRHAGQISRYERQIRSGAILVANEPAPPSVIRDPAFRRVVIEVYKYRCAASGLRVVLRNSEAMVEAAHIHPFSESRDDDPRNGIALTPDMHWAMDKNLIAPGPDYLWHVSEALDPRIPDFARFVDLRGRKIMLPDEPRMYPKREALAWRLEKLRNPDWNADLDV